MDSEFRIGKWLVQPDRRLLIGGEGAVQLSPAETKLLVFFASRAGKVVSRQEAVREVWGDTGTAQEGKLTRYVSQLREAFGDDSRSPSIIETVAGQGYRLIAPVSGPVAGAGVASRYRLVERIGDGGMGVVYKAEDTRLKRTVALKFLPEAWSGDPVAKERFLQEARAAAALDHPNICTLHEASETEDGRMFFVMAYYEGETLKVRLTRGPLPWREAVEIARQVAAGLTGAHRLGIIHRDVKPANIIMEAITAHDDVFNLH